MHILQSGLDSLKVNDHSSDNAELQSSSSATLSPEIPHSQDTDPTGIDSTMDVSKGINSTMDASKRIDSTMDASKEECVSKPLILAKAIASFLNKNKMNAGTCKKWNKTPRETIVNINIKATPSQKIISNVKPKSNSTSNIKNTDKNVLKVTEQTNESDCIVIDCAPSEAKIIEKVCKSCKAKNPKYKCPACEVLSCSLECVKQHKTQTGCSGIRVPVKNIGYKDMDEGTLLLDYRFLEGVRERLAQSLHDPTLHHLETETRVALRRKYRNNRQGMKDPVLHPAVQNTYAYPDEIKKRFKHLIPNYHRTAPVYSYPKFGGRSDLPNTLRRLAHQAKTRGTELVFMPRDMSRRLNNTTYYTAKHQAIRWHVQLQFVHANVFFDTIADENASVGRIIAKLLETSIEQMKGLTLDQPSLPINNGIYGNYKVTENKEIDDPMEEDWSESRNGNTTTKKILNGDMSLVTEKQVPEILYRNAVSNGINNCEDISSGNLNSKENLRQPVNADLISSKKPIDSVPLNSFHDAFTSKLVTEMPSANKNVQLPQQLSLDQQQQMGHYKADGVAGLTVACKNESLDKETKYLHLDIDDTLRNNLVGHRVVEYPILIVLRKDHAFEMFGDDHRVDRELDRVLKSNPTKELPSQLKAAENTLKYFDADESMDESW